LVIGNGAGGGRGYAEKRGGGGGSGKGMALQKRRLWGGVCSGSQEGERERERETVVKSIHNVLSAFEIQDDLIYMLAFEARDVLCAGRY